WDRRGGAPRAGRRPRRVLARPAGRGGARAADRQRPRAGRGAADPPGEPHRRRARRRGGTALLPPPLPAAGGRAGGDGAPRPGSGEALMAERGDLSPVLSTRALESPAAETPRALLEGGEQAVELPRRLFQPHTGDEGRSYAKTGRSGYQKT